MTAHSGSASAPPLQLHHNAYGQLVLTLPDGSVHEDVEPYRCFPWSAPHVAISLVGRDGRELINLPDLTQLPDATRKLLEADLAEREFVPVIQRIAKASGLWPPCTWEVVTDRGPAMVVIESEDDVRKLGPHGVLIADASGLRFRIPDTRRLDQGSLRHLRRLL
uniref:DUF1854 domain-containing protein n=1 Tax=Schlesneria paludicola TaxID=360056 RepID=A0A7C4LQW9_9PLAN